MAAKKPTPSVPAGTAPTTPPPQPLTLSDSVRGSLRQQTDKWGFDDAGRNERLYIRENSSDPKLRGAIADELATLAAAKIKHNEVQRAKAKKPRGAGDDGRTTHQLVADIVKGHPIGPLGAKPADLLERVQAAIEENGMEPIKDKWAKELIARELSARKRRTPRT